MSVDFGSQYLKIGLVKPGVPMEIVLNRESRRKTPNLVGIRSGERTFGDPALNIAVKYPKQAYVHLLDLLGKKFDNPIVHLHHKRFPYYELEADDNRGTVYFKADDGGQSTRYSVEMLAAMILSEARKVAEKFAEQPVKDCVITVPPFFNQAERKAMTTAANIAGLNLLQLINDNSAAALNYGAFRRKQFNDSMATVLLFDMGASKTTATCLEYRMVKEKNGEKNPQMTVLGVGSVGLEFPSHRTENFIVKASYDRTLGGLEMSLRLRDHLVKLFNGGTKTVQPVEESARAMAKFLKEAERVKQVLSANLDHYAQLEHVHEDKDFRAKVTREEFEKLTADLIDRVEAPIQSALKMAELSPEQVDTIILMGGSTRNANVQEKLKQVMKGKELGKFINTDDAAALGAVYQAAHLSKGFKVKRFNIKEMTLFPIQVDFEREESVESTATEKKVIQRTLFGLRNPYPMKKMLTFSKHLHDFEFRVNYGNLNHLSAVQLSEFGELNVSRIDFGGVTDAVSANVDTTATKSETSAAEAVSGESTSSVVQTKFQGVKAHFRLDESGILILDSVLAFLQCSLKNSRMAKLPHELFQGEVVFEKAHAEEDAEAESTLSKIGKKIGSLFGSANDEGVKKRETEQGSPKKDEEHTKEKSFTEGETSKAESTESDKPESASSDEKTDTKKGSEEANNESVKKDEEKAKDSAAADDVSSKEKKPVAAKQPKPKLVKVQVNIESAAMDLPVITKAELKTAKRELDKFDKIEKEKADKEAAQNALESFVFETRDKLSQDEFRALVTEEEHTRISEALQKASDWMDESVVPDTTGQEFKNQLSALNGVTKDMFGRQQNSVDRPKAVALMNSMLNYSESFMKGLRNLSDELQIFTETEMDTLEKLINTTKKWWKEKQEEQAKLRPHEKAAFTLDSVIEKAAPLDREIKYLLNKAKITPPKKAKNATSSAANETSSAAANETKVGEEKADKTEDKAAAEQSEQATTDADEPKTEKKAEETDENAETKPDESETAQAQTEEVIPEDQSTVEEKTAESTSRTDEHTDL